jgi:hypothetical protein
MIPYIAIFIVFFIFGWQYAAMRKRRPWIGKGMSEDEWYNAAEELTKAGIFKTNPYPVPKGLQIDMEKYRQYLKHFKAEAKKESEHWHSIREFEKKCMAELEAKNRCKIG